MNFCQKSAHLYEFIPNSCQFILIFRRFYLAYLTHTSHINTPIPIFNPKTNIPTQMNKKNRKIPNFPPFWKFFIMTFVNIGN